MLYPIMHCPLNTSELMRRHMLVLTDLVKHIYRHNMSGSFVVIISEYRINMHTIKAVYSYRYDAVYMNVLENDNTAWQ